MQYKQYISQHTPDIYESRTMNWCMCVGGGNQYKQYISQHTPDIYESRTMNWFMFVGGGDAVQTIYKSTLCGHIWVTNYELVHVCRWRKSVQTIYKSTYSGHIWVTNYELVHFYRWRRSKSARGKWKMIQYISQHTVDIYESRTMNWCIYIGGGDAVYTIYKSTHCGHKWVTNHESVHLYRWRRYKSARGNTLRTYMSHEPWIGAFL